MSQNPVPTVVITGASAGVGRATALRFARAGAKIGLIARDRGALEEVREEVERLGGTGLVADADVADANALFAAADAIEAGLGPIDIWINDAMVTVFGPVWELEPAEYQRVTEVTYLGFVHGTMAALKHMRPRDRGTIVQVGSALAYRGIPLQSAYCGAKHAIRGFTDSLRTELIHAHSGVKLTMVELPAVNTPQFDWARTHMEHQPRPVAPVVQPEVIADAIYAAALNPRREVWIGRSTLELILSNFIVPAAFDRYLSGAAYAGQGRRKLVSPHRADNLETPVRDLHRTRGSFDDEAGNGAITVSGPAARLGSVVAGGIALLGAGYLARRVMEARR